MHHFAFTKNSMSAHLKSRPLPLRGAGAFAAVSIWSVKRFVCHFLIVLLALLSGGAYAHVAADAAQDRGQIAAQLVVVNDTVASFEAEHDRGHSETCSHCGHATEMLGTIGLRFNDAVDGAALPSPAFWASHEHPNDIDRPKWSTTTSSVVNL